MRNPYQARRPKPNTLQLDSSLERYRFFIKTIVETQSVWGLFQEGWAIGATSQGRNSLPLWANRSFASLCQTDTWAKYVPTAISLDSFIFKMLPYAISENVLLSIMMTPEGQSVFLEPNKVLIDLKNYLYEVYLQKPEFFQTHPDVPLPRHIRIHH